MAPNGCLGYLGAGEFPTIGGCCCPRVPKYPDTGCLLVLYEES